jgi:hypothetical protein
MKAADDDKTVTLCGDNQGFGTAHRNCVELASRLESVADDDHEGAWNGAPGGEFGDARTAVFDGVKTQKLLLFVFVHHVFWESGCNTLQGEAPELFAIPLPVMATAMTSLAVMVFMAARVLVTFHCGGTSWRSSGECRLVWRLPMGEEVESEKRVYSKRRVRSAIR